MKNPSAREIAAEATETLARNPETSEQQIRRLVRAGFINTKGQVTTLLGGEATPEPDAEVLWPVKPQDGQAPTAN